MGNNQNKHTFDDFKGQLYAKGNKNTEQLMKYVNSREFNLLVDTTNGFNGLMYVISENREELANIMINNGSNTILVSFVSRHTPLLLAIHSHMTKTASKLISMDCNPYNRDKDGNNAFMLACIKGMPTIAFTIWTKYGSNDCRIHNSNHDTQLILACSSGLEDVALNILQIFTYVSDINSVNRYGQCAKDYAITNNLNKVISRIIEIEQFTGVTQSYTPRQLDAAPPAYENK